MNGGSDVLVLLILLTLMMSSIILIISLMRRKKAIRQDQPGYTTRIEGRQDSMDEGASCREHYLQDEKKRCSLSKLLRRLLRKEIGAWPSRKRPQASLPASCEYLLRYISVGGPSTPSGRGEVGDGITRQIAVGERFVPGDIETVKSLCLEVAADYRLEELPGDVPIIRLVKDVEDHTIIIYIRAPVNVYGMAYWIWAHIDGLHVYPPDPRDLFSCAMLMMGRRAPIRRLPVRRVLHTIGWAQNLRSALQETVEAVSELLSEIKQLGSSWDSLLHEAKKRDDPMYLYHSDLLRR